MKRYYLSVTEEMVMNPEYFGYRGGRIEVYDRKDKMNPYAVYEARFFVPECMFEKFREVFDGKYVDDAKKYI